MQERGVDFRILRGAGKMTKNSTCGAVLFFSLFFCAVVSSGAAQSGSQQLVSPELLKAGKLEIVWQKDLPIGKKDSLEQLIILGDRIYALTNHKYIVSLNRNTGDVGFSRPMVRGNLPVVGLELYNGELYSVAGDRLVEIDPEFGTELDSTRLAYSVTCPVSRNNSFFYIGGSDRRLHALRSKDKVQVFEVAADNDSLITSIVAGKNFVVFGTDAGNVISMTADRPGRLWELNAADEIVALMISDARSLFVTSKDTNVYKVDLFTGALVWKYPAGAVLERGPRVTKGVVYQYAHGEGLAAIEKESGKIIWRLGEGVDLLAETGGKAYVFAEPARLVVMDNKTAKQLYSVNFAPVTKYATNVTDSAMYIANDSGRLVCVRPSK